jgi:hypothetical protein
MVGKLLIVDDVATNRIVLKARLASAGYRPVVAADAGSALALAAGDRPDLALIAANLPGPNGGQNGSQNGPRRRNRGPDRAAARPSGLRDAARRGDDRRRGGRRPPCRAAGRGG